MTGIKDGNETPVLDLTLKKNSGWMGNLIGGYGTKDRYEGNANINHFTDDMNLSFVGAANNTRRQGNGQRTQQNAGVTYAKKSKELDIRGNVNYRHNVNETSTETSSETFLGDESTYANRRSDSENGNHSLNGNTWMEWRADSLNTINAYLNMNYSQSDSWRENWNKTSDNNHDDVSETTSSSTGNSQSYNLNGGGAFYHRFRKAERNLHMSFSFSHNNNDRDNYNRSFSQFFVQDSISDIDRNTRGKSNSTNWNISVGYIEPLSKHYRLSMNYSFSNSRSLSQSLVYDSINYADRFNYDYNEELSSKVNNKYANHNINLSIQGDHTQNDTCRKV